MTDFQVIEGDALDILSSLNSQSVAALITDPPYAVGTASNRRSSNKPMGWADINNASRWFSSWYKEGWRILQDNGCLWTFCSWRTLPIVQCAASRVGGMFITSVVVWDKDWIGVGSTKGVRESFELLALMAKSDFKIKDRSISNIWKVPWASQRPSGHPSEKPELLINKILDVSNISGLIVDPFLGSGTTGACAVQNGLNFLGVDLEPAWVEYSNNRISKACSQLNNSVDIRSKITTPIQESIF